MIGKILYLFTRKKLVFFAPHRNSNALLNDVNRQQYIFMNPLYLWKSTAVAGRNSKRRYRLMAMLLTMFGPAYIVDINWITKLHTLYFVWCKKHAPAKFIVVQHGAYVGGNITDKPHRIAKCQVMLVWSEYFKNLMLQYNAGKKISFPVFGNPPFNQYNRQQFAYRVASTQKKILVVIAPFKTQRMSVLLPFMNTLVANGCQVFLKEHAMQKTMSRPIEGFDKVHGNLYDLLQKEKYDIVITDVSSSMADIIFFKNKAIFFSPEGDDPIYSEPNLYSRYLKNAAEYVSSLTSFEALYSFVNIDAQEKLLQQLVQPGDNRLMDY